MNLYYTIYELNIMFTSAWCEDTVTLHVYNSQKFFFHTFQQCIIVTSISGQPNDKSFK